MIFDVKTGLTRKARLVCGGHLVDPHGLTLCSTVVKSISVRILDIIAHRDKLTILCGDVGNAFVTADCLEQVYSRTGPEFGECQGTVVMIEKALYGLRSSSQAFRLHFSEILRGTGFTPSRYDRDVWMRLCEDAKGYDYICTHVDDLKIVAKDPQCWMNVIKGTFLIKSEEPPSYYLGNNYIWDDQNGCWILFCHTYVKECIRRIEAPFPGFGVELVEHHTPLPPECHPEMDTSPLLDNANVQQYQMLIGMAQWANIIGRLDISFAISSLSCFQVAPREEHLRLVFHLFGYIKKHPNRQILLTADPLNVDEELKANSFNLDFLEDYPDAVEQIDSSFYLAPKGKELETSIFFDSDHAHDQVTRHSITGIIIFVGSTPAQWWSSHQGCIATLTYCAEFMAMCTAVEETIAL